VKEKLIYLLMQQHIDQVVTDDLISAVVTQLAQTEALEAFTM